MLEDAAGDLLASTAFTKEHWRQIWSNNPHVSSRDRETAPTVTWRPGSASATMDAPGDLADRHHRGPEAAGVDLR
jgi:hypothetical protein